MHTGIVKFFSVTRGYGFITQGVGKSDVFVSIEALMRSGLKTLTQGDRVSFDIASNGDTGKMAATNLQPSPLPLPAQA